MRIAFRADASQQMGIGHLMRCLTVAHAAKKRGAETRFICRHLPESLRTLVADSGHNLVELPHSSVSGTTPDLRHAHWLGTTQAVDTEDSLCALSDHHWDWVVVDSYALDARWETPMRKAATRCFVIDDLADRPHDADILLDQNILAHMGTRYDGKVPAGCKLLLGPCYALLREAFVELRKKLNPHSGKVERVLVSFGGTDPQDYTARALEAIVSTRLQNLIVEVVLGSGHPNPSGIERICAQHGFKCHVNTARMAELMASADLAIGAGGSASWERCCLGLPTICLPTADNQIPIVRGLADRGAIVALEPLSSVVAGVSRALLALVSRPDDVIAISMNARRLVDGHGTQRVCDSLFESA